MTLATVALGVAACAQGNAPSAQPPGQRIIVTTFAEWPSAAEVALRVADIARVPVRDAMEDVPRRYRMTLQCDAEATCDAALKRLAAGRGIVQGVERDARQRIPGKPDRESSR